MRLGRASELYCGEVVAGKPGADAAVRELDRIERALGAATYLRDLGQADITEVRNQRRAMTTRRGAGKDPSGKPLEKLVSPGTVNRTMQTLGAVLYHVRDNHEAFLRPNLKFGITKEESIRREVSEAEQAVLVEALREDYRDIFAFALLSGILETGLCMLERSRVDLRNALVRLLTPTGGKVGPFFLPHKHSVTGPFRARPLCRCRKRSIIMRCRGRSWEGERLGRLCPLPTE
jgi:hypothetical protein